MAQVVETRIHLNGEMKLDFLEKQEINDLIKKYQCERDSQIILDNLCSSGRVNKAKMNRSGLNDKNIQAAMTRLRLALHPYKD